MEVVCRERRVPDPSTPQAAEAEGKGTTALAQGGWPMAAGHPMGWHGATPTNTSTNPSERKENTGRIRSHTQPLQHQGEAGLDQAGRAAAVPRQISMENQGVR